MKTKLKKISNRQVGKFSLTNNVVILQTCSWAKFVSRFSKDRTKNLLTIIRINVLGISYRPWAAFEETSFVKYRGANWHSSSLPSYVMEIASWKFAMFCMLPFWCKMNSKGTEKKIFHQYSSFLIPSGIGVFLYCFLDLFSLSFKIVQPSR